MGRVPGQARNRANGASRGFSNLFKKEFVGFLEVTRIDDGAKQARIVGRRRDSPLPGTKQAALWEREKERGSMSCEKESHDINSTHIWRPHHLSIYRTRSGASSRKRKRVSKSDEPRQKFYANGVAKMEEKPRLPLLPSGIRESLVGIRGILWVVQSIDLWLVSQPHSEGAMKYSDRHLADLSARPPDRVELIGAGSLGYGTGPSFG